MFPPRCRAAALPWIAALACGCMTHAAAAPPPAAAPSGRAAGAAAPARTSAGAGAAAHRPEEPPPQNPEASRGFLEHAGEPAAPFAATPPSRVTAIALENTARGEAVGMEPRGDVALVVLREGERASTTVELQPNECATFIAQGGLGAIEVDLFLTVREGTSVRIVAEDRNTGPIAVIGGKTGCFRNGATKLTLELHARMRRGAGAVLVRGFRR